MPLRPLKAREIVRKLERAGFRLTRQSGGHARYVKGQQAVTVPMHPGDIPVPVIRSLLRQACLTPEEWEEL
ncbi:MAG: type II toxin-antitoxin system HicA family toxin [Deltaproteobacteria bacterium]|nr:type II toxin-antitoxin system HicA family toxin [Deltaproteobacteria bacterium]